MPRALSASNAPPPVTPAPVPVATAPVTTAPIAAPVVATGTFRSRDEVALADLQAAQVNREYATIRAPEDGLVQQRLVAPGATVASGAAILVVGGPAPVATSQRVRIVQLVRDLVAVTGVPADARVVTRGAPYVTPERGCWWWTRPSCARRRTGAPPGRPGPFAVRRWQFTVLVFLMLIALGASSWLAIPRAEDPTSRCRSSAWSRCTPAPRRRTWSSWPPNRSSAPSTPWRT
jgi:hypothetical protein